MNTAMITAKGFLKSKLVWLGILNVAIALLDALTQQAFLEQYWETLLAVNGVLIVILRAFTTQPIATSPIADSVRSVTVPPLPPLK